MKTNNNNVKRKTKNRKIRNDEVQRPAKAHEPKTGFKVAARHKEGCSLATQSILNNFLDPYQSELACVPKSTVSYYGINNVGYEYVTYTAAEPVALRTTFSVKVGTQVAPNPYNCLVIPASGQLLYNDSNYHAFSYGVGGLGATTSSATFFTTWNQFQDNSVQEITARNTPSSVGSRLQYSACLIAMKLKIKANHLPPTQKKGSLSILVGQGSLPDSEASLIENPRTMRIDADATSDEGIQILCPGNGYLDQSNAGAKIPAANGTTCVPYIYIQFNGVSDGSGEAIFDFTLEACGYYAGWQIPTRKTLQISNEAWYCALSCFREATKNYTVSFKGERKDIRRIAQELANKHESSRIPGMILEGLKFGASHLVKYAAKHIPDLLTMLL
jgi:hypothetical protein